MLARSIFCAVVANVFLGLFSQCLADVCGEGLDVNKMDLQTIKDCFVALKNDLENSSPRIPAGAILMSEMTCDKLGKGWSPVVEAGGRFVVGAGNHPNTWKNENSGNTTALSKYKAYGEAPEGGWSDSTGGEELHQLSAEELPSGPPNFTAKDRGGFQLFVSTVQPCDSPGTGCGQIDALVSSERKSSLRSSPITGFDGGQGKSQNNLPPYVALYFCKKE